MSTPVWPLALPQKPDRNNYQESVNDERLFYEMDFGTKTRITGNITPEIMTCTYVLSDEQYNIFKAFVIDTLKKAMLAFDFPHPVDDKKIRVAFKSKGKNNPLWQKKYYKNTMEWEITIDLDVFTAITI